MPTSEKSKNLYQRLLAITEEVGKIDKTGTNTSQGYKFIESAMVVAEIRVQMAKHGVMIMPETTSRRIDRYTTMKPGYNNAPAKESVSFHVNVGSRYTIINADNPEERFVCEWDGGEALDTSDKATNKATTASEKTFLMKLFKISDKDDPDASHHEVEAPRKQTIDPPAPEEPYIQVDEDLGKKKEDKIALVKHMNTLLKAAGHTTPDEAEWVYLKVLGKKGPTNAGEIKEVIKSLENPDGQE